jgi:5-methylcytosine-specific restriction endonuclease McrA
MPRSPEFEVRRYQALRLAGPLASAWPAPPSCCQNCGGPIPVHRKGKPSCSAMCKHPFDPISYGRCMVCSKPFVVRPKSMGLRKTCSTEHAAIWRDVLAAVRKRRREQLEGRFVSDIRPERELSMRREARDCPLCGVLMTAEPRKPNSKHLDHIVPIGIGGTHTLGNVRIICADCNLRRPKDGSDVGMVRMVAGVSL